MSLREYRGIFMTNHHTKNIPILCLVFLGSCLVFLGSCVLVVAEIENARYEKALRECGCRSGDVYSSVSGLFNVVVPTAGNRPVDRFHIFETSEQEGPLFVEEVSFLISGFGELYRAGVVRLNQQFAPLARTDIAASVAHGLAQIPLSRHFQGELPGEIELIRFGRVTTDYGQAVHAIYRVEEGSQLVETTGFDPRETPTPNDALVAVVVVPIGNYLIFTTAQNDFLAREDDESVLIASIDSKTATLMNLLTWSRELPGDAELPNTARSPLRRPHLEQCVRQYFINDGVAFENTCKEQIAFQIVMSSDQDNVVEDVIQSGETLRFADEDRGFTFAICPSGYEADRTFDRENLRSIRAGQYNCSRREAEASSTTR